MWQIILKVQVQTPRLEVTLLNIFHVPKVF